MIDDQNTADQAEPDEVQAGTTFLPPPTPIVSGRQIVVDANQLR